MTSIPPTKCCTKCGRELPATVEYFTTHKKTRDGLYPSCRSCKQKVPRNYSEAVRARNKKKYNTNRANPEWVENKNLQARERYRICHPLPVIEFRTCTKCGCKKSITQFPRNGRAISSHCKACKSRWYSEYVRQNPHIGRVRNHQRRSRKNNLPHTLTEDQWKDTLEYFDNKCAVCGRSSASDSEYTLAIDHWIPLADKDCPGTTVWNCIPLCHGKNGCNNSKHNTPALVWLIKKYGHEKALVINEKITTFLNMTKNLGEDD